MNQSTVIKEIKRQRFNSLVDMARDIFANGVNMEISMYQKTQFVLALQCHFHLFTRMFTY